MQRRKINKSHFSPPTFDDISQIDQQRTHRNKYWCLLYSSSNRFRLCTTII